MFKRNCGFSHKVFIALMLLMMSIYSHSALSMCCANILPFSHTHRGSTRSHRVRWDSETAHIEIWHDMRHTILLYLFGENICDMNSFWRGLYLHHVLMNMRKSLIYLMFVCGCLSVGLKWKMFRHIPWNRMQREVKHIFIQKELNRGLDAESME